MGCGASTTQNLTKTNSVRESKQPNAASNPEISAAKEKYFSNCVFAAYPTDGTPTSAASSVVPVTGHVILYNDRSGTESLVIGFRHLESGTLFSQHFTDEQLITLKKSNAIVASWATILKAITSDIAKGKCTLTAADSSVTITCTIPGKEGDIKCPLILPIVEATMSKIALFNMMLVPLTEFMQKRRATGDDKETARRVLECDEHVKSNSYVTHAARREELLGQLQPLRIQTTEAKSHATSSEAMCGRVQYQLHNHRIGQRKCYLDRIYEDGGAQNYPLHIPASKDHTVRITDPHGFTCQWIDLAFKQPVDQTTPMSSFTTQPSNPELQRLLASAPNAEEAQLLVQVFERLDNWDFDVFSLERLTKGGALYHVTLAILFKLGLIQKFNIDASALHHFLLQVQAGYFANPYHNSTHASDVTQINYFLIARAGLGEKLALTDAQLLGAILAGTVHDYNHPGFNNLFHSRTNAYLSTLYNDRSVLENHHLACVFEMMRKPQFDFLGALPEAVRLEIRETMVEMVLATDMGNHAKIFSSFRRRLSEAPNWAEKKEDKLLALSMSIKAADISNCARPTHLYTQWAKNIADEFYYQGDIEAQLGLSISPFMDRSKDKTDFHKGQISFMNYVIVPVFEAVTEFLPVCEMTIQHCTENKAYWNATATN